MLDKSTHTPLADAAVDRRQHGSRSRAQHGRMARILVCHASIDGQTERIARRIAATLSAGGHVVDVRSIHEPGLAGALQDADAVVIGGGIRFGRHARRLVEQVRDFGASIAARPNAFFSVSLSAGGPGAKPANARGYVEAFTRETGWQPRAVATFAGALQYTRYNALIRLLMKLVVGAAGGETDTTRDFEYTDWGAVEGFARDIARVLEPATA